MNISDQIQELKPWFHNIHLPTGEQTAPDHFLGNFPHFKWEKIKTVIPEDLTGWRVLDIGCNAGFYSVELAKRGAHVLAIDLDEHYLKQARWIAKQFGLEDKITFKQMQIYDLAHVEDSFDLIWFMGVFYHLRYPLLALDILASKCERLLLFQTFTSAEKKEIPIPEDIDFQNRDIFDLPAWPKLSFIPHKLAGDLTNWWVINHQGIVSLLDNCGFTITDTPDDETYLAEIDKPKSIQQNWNASEYLSAVGKDWQNAIAIKTEKK